MPTPSAVHSRRYGSNFIVDTCKVNGEWAIALHVGPRHPWFQAHHAAVASVAGVALASAGASSEIPGYWQLQSVWYTSPNAAEQDFNKVYQAAEDVQLTQQAANGRANMAPLPAGGGVRCLSCRGPMQVPSTYVHCDECRKALRWLING